MQISSCLCVGNQCRSSQKHERHLVAEAMRPSALPLWPISCQLQYLECALPLQPPSCWLQREWCDCCRVALEAGDMQQLACLMDQNFDLRRQLFGDAAIGADNLRMIQTARSVGGRACIALPLLWVLGPEGGSCRRMELWGGLEQGGCTVLLLRPVWDSLCSQQPATRRPCLLFA